MFKNLTLIQWYSENKRDLPWRYNTDAYTVWLSEIILQQTRVAQGLEYFIKFKKNYPTVHNLAQAPLDEVLKLWQGLGYYTRARNLHATAKTISELYNGEFPSSFEGLRKLKGIGDYTAAAIASISYNIPIAVVDGNVLRVLARLFGVFTPIDSSAGKKEFNDLAQHLLNKEQPGTYNQAIMDFGAMVCTPKAAQCIQCPFNNICYAYINQCIYQLPVKTKKIKTRVRYFYYLVVHFNDSIFIRQRTEKDIWHLLYEFPLIEHDSELTIENLTNTHEWQTLFEKQHPIITSISDKIKHQLSHQTLWCYFYNIKINKPSEMLLKGYKKIKVNEFEKFSVSRLIENYMISNESKK